MINISVIVPVYNVEKYLRKCIDSILSQTFTNFELLLVNDGSKDSSGAICDEYATKDSRIRVFHKENGGVSSARNLGLQNASGEYITFVDADDYISLDFLETFLGAHRNSSLSTLTLCGYERKNLDGDIIRTLNFRDNNFEVRDIYLNDDDLRQIIGYGTIWGKFFARDIIVKNCIQFDENIQLHEDHLFYLQYIVNIDHIITIDYCGYYYVTDNLCRSLSTGRVHNPEKLYYSYEKCWDAICDIVASWHLNLSQMNVAYSVIYPFGLDALKNCYIVKLDRNYRIGYLKLFRKIDVFMYYRPISRTGKFFKFALVCLPKEIKDFIFRIIIR